MDNFKVIYKILYTLEKALDYERFDISQISSEQLNISYTRWSKLILMMYDNGLIDGVARVSTLGGPDGIKIGDICITIKGLEYLEQNSFMKKAENLLKGIKDTIPGL